MTSPVRPKVQFRALRLGFVLHFDERTLTGQTTHIGSDEIGVRVPPGADHALLPAPGARGVFRLVHASTAHLSFPVTCFWRSDLQANATELELGLRVATADAQQRLREFMTSFQHTVLWLGPARDVLVGDLRKSYRVVEATTAEEASALLEGEDICAVVALEPHQQLSPMALARRRPEPAPPLICSAGDLLSEEAALELSHAFYFLRQPFRSSELCQAVRRAVESHVLQRDTEQLAQELERINRRLLRENLFLRRKAEGSAFQKLLGRSEAWKSLIAQLECALRVDTTVSLHGETGTGKELLARALHSGGSRAKGPFVPYNCAGLPESLLQSILFGHTRGAFTGADRAHTGIFEQANSGTLFLDEIGELPLSVQASLLRVLQERVVLPLGATQPLPVDVRIISATHKDLRQEVLAGRFREDLYYRIAVLSVTVPPLRDRAEDILPLALHFLRLHSERIGRPPPKLASSAEEALLRYHWPGNVRELENEMARLAVLGDENEPVEARLLSPHLQATAWRLPTETTEDHVALEVEGSFDEALEHVKRALVERALARSDGNVTAAAAALGMERSRLGKLHARLQNLRRAAD